MRVNVEFLFVGERGVYQGEMSRVGQERPYASSLRTSVMVGKQTFALSTKESVLG